MLNWGIKVSELGLQCIPVVLLHYFADKGPSSQGYGFSSSHSHVWI